MFGNGLTQWLWVEDIWEWGSTVVMGGGYLGMGWYSGYGGKLFGNELT
jgi:hypothetical protein